MVYGTLQLHGEALPVLIAHINNRGLTPQIVAGADSYAQQHTTNLNCAAMSAMLSARQYVKAGRSRGLLHHLRHLSSFCEATDERDRVYALLGLATDAERSALHFRYSESTAQVYHRTAKVLIEQGSGIGVLYEASCHKYLVGFPSWAPNWTERVSENLGWTTSAEGVKTFRATDSARRTINISADGRLLHVRGIHLDIIEALTEPLEEDPASSASLLSRLNKITRLWDFQHASVTLAHKYEDTLRYPPGEGQVNALWRTLIFDMTNDLAGNLKRPAPSSFANSFLAFAQLKNVAIRDDPNPAERRVREIQPFMTALDHTANFGRFCVTRDGYMGVVPKRAAKGDGICVFLGGSVPFVIRRTASRHYSLVGECYVHGLMDGKALDMVLDVDWMEEGDITLE